MWRCFASRHKPELRARGRRAVERGFTLIEMLVVLVIVGLLVGIAAPQIMRYLGTAKSGTARTQVERLSSILDLYRLEVGRYPDETAGLSALVSRPPNVERWNGPYLKNAEALVDPWGRPFQYRYPGQHGEFDVYSLGADGQEGGDGEALDLTNW